MGGSKSKPLTESARTVLARRQPDMSKSAEVQQLAENLIIRKPQGHSLTNAKVYSAISADKLSAAGQTSDSNDSLNPSILKEISKWEIVKTKTQTVSNTGPKMATSIRHEEEKSTHSLPRGHTVPGRVTEVQAISLLTHARDGTKDTITLAKEFHIPEDVLSEVFASLRMPIIVQEGKGDDVGIGIPVAK